MFVIMRCNACCGITHVVANNTRGERAINLVPKGWKKLVDGRTGVRECGSKRTDDNTVQNEYVDQEVPKLNPFAVCPDDTKRELLFRTTVHVPAGMRQMGLQRGRRTGEMDGETDGETGGEKGATVVLVSSTLGTVST